MPHLNRSPSSPGLRDPPKQAADELLLPRRSISRSKFSRCHTPIRTFSSRRPRPTVASIADVFASSLVLAGFCHEHSPRNRRPSTLQSRTSEQHLRGYHYRPVAARHQTAISQRRECSRFPFQQLRPRSWLSVFLGGAENDTHDQNEASTMPRSTISDPGNNTVSGQKEETDGRSRGQSEGPRFPSISQSTSDLFLERKGHGNASMVPEAEKELNHTSTLSYDERNYMAMSRLYKKMFGDTLDAEQAVETMLAMPKPRHGLREGRDEIEIASVARLVEVLKGDTFPTTQHLFRLYREIPTPGVAKLSKHSRGLLLRRLANPPNRRWADARRYLALVDDMTSAGLPMSRSLWSTAIHFAGRGNGSGKVLKRDLVRAIGFWQRMEHVAGIPADDVVFNILFDVAAKSGQYTVAIQLEKEMLSRGISFSRFGMISKMFFHGLRKKSHALTQTFEEFVKSGEIVDTVVLNCLCASYFRAGQTGLAEQLYTHMMENRASCKHMNTADQLSESKPVLSSEYFRYRTINRQLARLCRNARYLQQRLPDQHRMLQNSMPMTPDTRTFYIFLRHYACQDGHFNKFKSIVSDMERTFEVPPRHMVFMLLFEGFGLHGGYKKSWSAERLRQVWFAYLRALRESKKRLDDLSEGIESTRVEWENPLGTSANPDFANDIPESDPGGFYMSLPSTGRDDAPVPPEMLNMMKGLHSPQESDTTGQCHDFPSADSKETKAVIETKRPEYDFIDTQWNPEIEPDFHHHGHLKQRLENGVFVGRKMIVLILRAFGVCCGPTEVMEVWLQLERLWHPDHRKAQDVFVVKEELDRQMSKDPPHNVR